MPKLRVLSASQVLRILAGFGFTPTGQRGSHIKLRRSVAGENQILTVPNHSELDRGTLHAIYRQASCFIAESELRPGFFTE